MKLRTLGQLQDYLDQDFSWRLKEIADLKAAVRTSQTLRRSTVIRAGVPLLYAHWEGFVKNAANGYINFVSCKRLRFDELADNFVVLGAKNHLQNIGKTTKMSLNLEAVKFFRSKMPTRAEIMIGSAIDTESNLSSTVFENIARSVGIDYSRYEARANFIDTSLLRRRNHIAHGEFLELDAPSYRTLADEVITLLRWVKTDIENSASTDQYKC